MCRISLRVVLVVSLAAFGAAAAAPPSAATIATRSATQADGSGGVTIFHPSYVTNEPYPPDNPKHRSPVPRIFFVIGESTSKLHHRDVQWTQVPSGASYQHRFVANSMCCSPTTNKYRWLVKCIVDKDGNYTLLGPAWPMLPL